MPNRFEKEKKSKIHAYNFDANSSRNVEKNAKTKKKKYSIFIA